MKVLILGAGVIGVTSAWYLQRAGHEVSVVDRQSAAGLETSFANGGQISVSHAERQEVGGRNHARARPAHCAIQLPSSAQSLSP